MKELGVFCGTFNPIHWGHLLLAEFARDQFALDKVLFVTSPSPPHRRDDLLEAEMRHELVVAACKSNKHFEPSRLELERSGPSYTVDTLRALTNECGGSLRLNLLLGQDNLDALKSWHDSSALFKLCRILVASRHSSVTREDISATLPEAAQFELINFPQVAVSSSLVRKRLREEKSVLFLVTEEVNKILLDKKHYR